MITNMSDKNQVNVIKMLFIIIACFVFLAWLLTPPVNKFMQICLWGNNIKFFVSKIMDNESATEYIFHRNNAVYLARMYPNSKDKDAALFEIERAISTLPSVAPAKEEQLLYRDRAELKLFYGDKKGALRDYIKVRDIISYEDLLKVAMLFKEEGNYREAVMYCNLMQQINPSAYTGYACKAELYLALNRPDLALGIWNKAMTSNTGAARVYVDRAMIKKNLGDIQGYNVDIELAKKRDPNIDIERSTVDAVMRPKTFALEIRKI